MIWTIMNECELSVSCGRRTMICEIYDRSGSRRTIDSGVRCIDIVSETLTVSEPLTEPVIAPRFFARATHALLHDSPLAIVSDDEPMEIDVVPILNRRTIDFRNQSAAANERVAVEAESVGER